MVCAKFKSKAFGSEASSSTVAGKHVAIGSSGDESLKICGHSILRNCPNAENR